MSNPNDRQVGGSHYLTKSGTQHWDFAELDGLSYLEGCITKYLARAKKKHATPHQDLEKVVHYLDKLISLVKSGDRKPRPKVAALRIDIETFCREYQLDDMSWAIVKLVVFWDGVGDLIMARNLANQLLAGLT